MANLLERLPPDMHIMIMETMDTPSALCSYVDSVPSILMPTFLYRFESVIKAVFARQYPEELSQYVYAITLAQHLGPKALDGLAIFMTAHFEGMQPRRLLCGFPRTYGSLKHIADIHQTIEFFTDFCVDRFLAELPVGMQYPLSAGERMRLQRALLRFQLFCQIFHQPGNVDRIDSDSNWEVGYKALRFWSRFEMVEAEECRCIFVLLYHVLKPAGSWGEDKNIKISTRERGLPILRHSIEKGKLSVFEAGYVRCLVKYALSDSEEIHMDLGNHFNLARLKRYTPSESVRLVSFAGRCRRTAGHRLGRYK